MLAAAARPDTIGEPAGQPLSQRVLAGDNRSEAQRRADFLAVYRYLFICDILASEVCPLEVAPDADMFEIRSAFRLKGASFPFFRRVRVCGTVVNSKEEGNVLRVTMDDMTGCLDVRLAKRSIHPKRLAEIAKGALVEFLGDLQIQGSSKVVESSIFNVKTDPLHTILFPLRTIQLYQAHYFPDNFPEAARLYSQRMTQMQAMQAPSQMQPDSDDEDEFRSAIEDVGFLSDLGPGALDVPVAEKGGSDVEFDDDLDFANLMNVDFDAAAAAAIANKAPMVTKTPVKSQPTKRPVPLTPSFDDFDLGGAGDLDALLDGDVVMADPGTVDPGLSSAVQAFIAEGGGVRTKQEIDARFGGEHGLDAVGKVLTSLTDSFVAYQDGDRFHLM